MNRNYQFRKAQMQDIASIIKIIDFAKSSRKKDGSNQWQDGYPNINTIEKDIQNQWGYVLEFDKEILFYGALIFDVEPAYEKLKEGWLTNNKHYAVIHRLAAYPQAAGKGLAHKMMDAMEDKVLQSNFDSIRIDTNYDNQPMLNILKKRDYIYCGEVEFRGSARKAFEKVLD